MKHEDFMKEAIRLSEENVKKGGGPFGAVIVKDGKIVGRGANSVTTLNDPTATLPIMMFRLSLQLKNKKISLQYLMTSQQKL